MSSGKIKSAVDERRDLTSFSVEGIISADQLIKTIQQFYGENPTGLVLWDFTATNIHHLKTSEIEHIANTTRKFSYNSEVLRAALVFSSDVDFGLGRMFEVLSHAGRFNQKIRSFHSRENARNWLEAGI